MKPGYSQLLIALCCILGATLAVGPFLAHRGAERRHAHDYEEVRKLGAMLGAAQRAHTAATTAADSARFAADVKDRTHYLSQRAYHLPFQRANLDTYWQLGRAPMVSIFIGIVFLASAIFMLRRNDAIATEHKQQG